MLSIHNPPEARDGSFSTAGDVWALGVTLCQALTQRVPLKSGERRDLVVLPPDIPEAFNDILRRCLARNPAERPSVADLQEWLKKGSAVPAQLAPVTLGAAATAVPARGETEKGEAAKADRKDGPTRLVIRAVISPEPPAPEPVERRSFVPLILGAVAVVAVGWGAVSWYRGRAHTEVAPVEQNSAAVSQAQSSPPPPTAAPAGTSTAPAPSNTTAAPLNASSSNSGRSAVNPTVTAAVNQDIPSVPPYARSTIHGHVKVTVRVTIDNSGAVVNDTLTRPGPSKYFARLASESARRWRFEPENTNGARQSLIRFDFSRTGTTAHVVGSD
jgi:TonB family protein